MLSTLSSSDLTTWFRSLSLTEQISLVASSITIAGIPVGIFAYFARRRRANDKATAPPGDPSVTFKRQRQPYHLILCDQATDVAFVCASIFVHSIRNNPSASIVLPTGRTGSSLFEQIVNISDFPDLSNCHFFIDTETFGVVPNHPTSRQRFVRDTLFNALSAQNVSLPPNDNLHFFSGYVGDTDTCTEVNYWMRIHPPDLHILAYSPDGEIIGYEPDSRLNIKRSLTERARVNHLSFLGHDYIDPAQPSRSIFTIGLGNVLDAKRLVVPVIHSKHSTVLQKVLTGSISGRCPATVVRLHPALTIVAARGFLPLIYRIGSTRIKSKDDVILLDVLR